MRGFDLLRARVGYIYIYISIYNIRILYIHTWRKDISIMREKETYVAIERHVASRYLRFVWLSAHIIQPGPGLSLHRILVLNLITAACHGWFLIAYFVTTTREWTLNVVRLDRPYISHLSRRERIFSWLCGIIDYTRDNILHSIETSFPYAMLKVW